MQNRSRGVTLIELMIVVAIIGILAAIAYPAYQDQVQASRRTDAKTALMMTAQRLERCYSRTLNYAAAECNAAVQSPSPEGFYNIAAGRNASTFTVTATPRGAQAADTTCAQLTINHAGIQAALDSSNANTTNECWN